MIRSTLRRGTLFFYIAREVLLYFAICFLFFFMVFFVNQMLLLAENVLKKRVPLHQVARLVLYCTPFVIAQSAPFATLVGFMMCVSRMASQSEVIVMRASGISYLSMSAPALLAGIAISIASFFVNDYLLPLGTARYNALYRKILMSNPAVELESRAIKKLNDSTLITGDVTGSGVTSIVVIDKDREKTRIVTAGPSRLTRGTDSGVLMRLEMTGCRAIILDKSNPYTFDEVAAGEAVFNIFDTAFFARPWQATPREMTSRDLHNKIVKMLQDEDTPSKLLNRYKAEMQKKFAQPFGAVFFALLALPLSIFASRRGGQTAGMIYGVVISVLYWAVMITGQIAAGRLGFNAFLCMWLPNFMAGTAGIALSFLIGRR